MAQGLRQGEEVFVSRKRLGLAGVTESSFLRTTVVSAPLPTQRTVEVDLLDGGNTTRVATSACHRRIGVCIYEVGDVTSESGLLDPMRKSIVQYSRLLLPHDSLVSRTVRSLEELRACWANHDHTGCSHVVLVGHGSEVGVHFAVGNLVSAGDLGAVFAVPGEECPTFISLCCRTGYASYAKPFQGSSGCGVLIAPFHSVHGAIACQFLQDYLGHHFLDGCTFKVAYNKAQAQIPSGVHFRFWENGVLKTPGS
jgi:hypothetical protein